MDYGLHHNTVSGYNVSFSGFYMLLYDRMLIFIGNTKIFGVRESDVSKNTSLEKYSCMHIYAYIHMCVYRENNKENEGKYIGFLHLDKNIIEFLGLFSQVSLKFEVWNKNIF